MRGKIKTTKLATNKKVTNVEQRAIRNKQKKEKLETYYLSFFLMIKATLAMMDH